MMFIDSISPKLDNYLIKNEHLKTNTHSNFLLLIRILSLKLSTKILYRIYNSSLIRASRKCRNKVFLKNVNRFCRVNKLSENQTIFSRVDNEK